MKYINSPNTIAVKPSYTGTGLTPAWAQTSGGTPTTWNPESYNMMMMELINAITGQGIPLNVTDDTLLSQALSAIKSIADSKTGIHFVTPRLIADNSTVSTSYQLFNISEVPSNASGIILSCEMATAERLGRVFSRHDGVTEYQVSMSVDNDNKAGGCTTQSFVPASGNDIYLKRTGSFNTLNVYIHGYII